MTTWTPAQIDTLVKMREAKVSAQKIAAVLGYSRSAILGKCLRLGLCVKNPPDRPKGAKTNPFLKSAGQIHRSGPRGGVLKFKKPRQDHLNAHYSQRAGRPNYAVSAWSDSETHPTYVRDPFHHDIFDLHVNRDGSRVFASLREAKIYMVELANDPTIILERKQAFHPERVTRDRYKVALTAKTNNSNRTFLKYM